MLYPPPTSRDFGRRDFDSQPTMSGRSMTKRKLPWSLLGIIVLTLITCMMPLSGNNADADLWGHVRFGRDAMRHGLPQTTTYSFTADGFRWINHENIAELTFARVADQAGGCGLLLLKCLLGLGVMGMMLGWQLRQRVSLITSCGLCLIVALNLHMFWQVRPQLFSYVFYALMLLLLEFCFSGWSTRWRLRSKPMTDDSEASGATTVDAEADSATSANVSIEEKIDYRWKNIRCLWLAPVLFAVWTNTHGAFAAGLAIYIAYMGLRSIEAWSQWRAESYGVLRRFTMMATAAALVTFLNPYGPRLHLWLVSSLGQPRPEITEWHGPNLFSSEWWPLLAISMMFFVAVSFSRRSRDFTHVAILAATLWQTIEHQRHAPFFVLAFGFWMAPQLDSALKRLGIVRENDEQESPVGWARFALGGAGFLAMAIISGAVIYRSTRMTVKRDEYPVSAVQYLSDENLNGRMVVTYNWAQYVLACLGERQGESGAPTDASAEGVSRGVTLAFDGRFRTCYPQDVVDMHFDFVLGNAPHWRNRSPDSPAFDPANVLKHGQPELVMISRHQPHAEGVMVQHSDQWSLLYQDSLAQVWGRKSVYDTKDSPRFLPHERRSISDRPQVGDVAWPAYPKPTRRVAAQAQQVNEQAASAEGERAG